MKHYSSKGTPTVRKTSSVLYTEFLGPRTICVLKFISCPVEDFVIFKPNKDSQHVADTVLCTPKGKGGPRTYSVLFIGARLVARRLGWEGSQSNGPMLSSFEGMCFTSQPYCNGPHMAPICHYSDDLNQWLASVHEV